MSKARFIIELEATPGDIPPEIRLRKLLKHALRSCGLRCTDMREKSTSTVDGDVANSVGLALKSLDERAKNNSASLRGEVQK